MSNLISLSSTSEQLQVKKSIVRHEIINGEYYLNLEDMATIYHEKISNWERLKNVQRRIQSFAKRRNQSIDDVYFIHPENNYRYAHLRIATKFAAWLDDDFEDDVFEWYEGKQLYGHSEDRIALATDSKKFEHYQETNKEIESLRDRVILLESQGIEKDDIIDCLREETKRLNSIAVKAHVAERKAREETEKTKREKREDELYRQMKQHAFKHLNYSPRSKVEVGMINGYSEAKKEFGEETALKLLNRLISDLSDKKGFYQQSVNVCLHNEFKMVPVSGSKETEAIPYNWSILHVSWETKGSILRDRENEMVNNGW